MFYEQHLKFISNERYWGWGHFYIFDAQITPGLKNHFFAILEEVYIRYIGGDDFHDYSDYIIAVQKYRNCQACGIQHLLLFSPTQDSRPFFETLGLVSYCYQCQSYLKPKRLYGCHACK